MLGASADMANDLKSLNKKFRAVVEAAKKTVQPSLSSGADELVAAQKSLAPVKTGKLRDSVRKELAPPYRVRVRAGGPTTTVAARQGQGEYDYAIGAEFGTSDTEAQSFFWPAYRLLKRRIRSRLKRNMSTAIRKEWQK